MVKIIEPRIETAELKPDGTYGKFVAEPLDRGFGITLGNSLRRVLLSSLPGVAVSSVKIDGIQHEFSTIPGVKEDVTEIILNIKGLTAKLYCDEPIRVKIAAEGECEVTAGSISGSSEVEVQSSLWSWCCKRARAMSPPTATSSWTGKRRRWAPFLWTASTPRC